MALYDEAMVSIITIHLVAFLYCIKPDLSIENYVQSFSFSQRFLLTLSFNITLLTSSSVSYMFQCELHSSDIIFNINRICSRIAASSYYCSLPRKC